MLIPNAKKAKRVRKLLLKRSTLQDWCKRLQEEKGGLHQSCKKRLFYAGLRALTSFVAAQGLPYQKRQPRGW